MHCGFHTKRGRRDTLGFFQKRRFQGFIYETLKVISLLGEKFIFSSPLEQQNLLEFSDFPLFMLSFLQTFQNNLNYAATSNIREIVKLYNLGDNGF